MEGLSPVIVIGMHRSGTTLMSKLLQKLGVFMGEEREQNEEAIAFLLTNEWILSQANATWDNPYNFRFLKKRHFLHIRKLLEELLGSPGFMKSFLGMKKWEDFAGRGCIWGWKDPRNTFTLEVWKDIFPSFKVIHIFRNPVDVAVSLKKREKKFFSNTRDFLNNRAELDVYSIVLRKASLFSSPRVENLEEGVALWKEYVAKAVEWEKRLADKVLSVRYESLLSNPFEELKRVVKFLELGVTEECLRMAASEIRKDRKFAFRGKEKLMELYDKVKNDTIVRELGYGSLEQEFLCQE